MTGSFGELLDATWPCGEGKQSHQLRVQNERKFRNRIETKRKNNSFYAFFPRRRLRDVTALLATVCEGGANQEFSASGDLKGWQKKEHAGMINLMTFRCPLRPSANTYEVPSAQPWF
jgi:hypothetical protein